MQVPFELSMMGGAIERRYQKLRPELDELPWGALAATRDAIPEDLLATSREVWTQLTFLEHRTAAAISATVHQMILARAPVDLVTVASRFVGDELTHVDLCARVLGELGGGVPLMHDPDALHDHPPAGRSPLLRATEMVMRVFCLGEAFSLPMSQLAARRAEHPLVAAVMRRIARDEAPHGRFGWTYLDWAGEHLGDDDREHLAGVIREGLEGYAAMIADTGAAEEPTLGWLSPHDFHAHAERAIEEEVVKPLAARGFWA